MDSTVENTLFFFCNFVFFAEVLCVI